MPLDYGLILIIVLVGIGTGFITTYVYLKKRYEKDDGSESSKNMVFLRQENANLREVIKMLSDIEYGSYASKEFYTKVINGVSILPSTDNITTTTTTTSTLKSDTPIIISRIIERKKQQALALKGENGEEDD